MEIREDVVERLVAWRLSGAQPSDDPERRMYRQIDDATPAEMMEAFRRILTRKQQDGREA